MGRDRVNDRPVYYAAAGPRDALRLRVRPAAAIAIWTAFALVYDEVQAHLSHVGLHDFQTTGTDGFYASLAASPSSRRGSRAVASAARSSPKRRTAHLRARLVSAAP